VQHSLSYEKNQNLTTKFDFFKPPLTLFNKKNNYKKNEKLIKNVNFNIFKFNNRQKPIKKDRITIISCFSEFGCETLGCMYCIPRLLKRLPGRYVIAIGWYGREYLYRHLVDEFWEIDESYMWLRDYTRAFHHESKNLKRIEESVSCFGEVVPSAALGKYAVSNFCRTCGKFWQEWRKQSEKCPSCKSTVIVRSIFTDVFNYKPQARLIPKPRIELLNWAKKLVGDNCVGIFARARKTYGRNLPADFYIRLIKFLKSMNYNIVWLGEKQNTLPCPVDDVIDFSKTNESRDLEKTLAIISCLKFTIQFWTASTRLAGMMGVPFILFESPEQIYSSFSGLMPAQEGKRLELTTFGPKKVVIAHYKSVLENYDETISLIKRSIDEINDNNWEDIIGLVSDENFSNQLKKEFYEMLK